jgi:hypothetical protein
MEKEKYNNVCFHQQIGKLPSKKTHHSTPKKIMLIEIKLLLHHIQAFGKNMMTKA